MAKDLKRMAVTDDELVLLSKFFPCFKELVLVSCEGFGTSGLAAVASRCRSRGDEKRAILEIVLGHFAVYLQPSDMSSGSVDDIPSEVVLCRKRRSWWGWNLRSYARASVARDGTATKPAFDSAQSRLRRTG